jgi:glycosyltransferase involved in cell wall biosynthesis
METLVSIITPSFNQVQYLEETILSVIGQEYKNIEYIVIDGGSNDGSIEIIKKYQKHITYWISEKDHGQADAINKGFAMANGELLCWVNSDDVLYPEYISTRVKQFDENKYVSMIYGDVDQGWDIISKTKRRGAQQTWNEMISTCLVKVPQMSAIWKKEVFRTLGGLNISLNVLLDWEYFVRIAKRFNILYCPGAVAFFRQHEGSKSIKMNSVWADELMWYYDNCIFSSKESSDLNEKKVRQNLYFLCSILYFEANEEPRMMEALKTAKEIDSLRYYRKYLLNQSVKFLVKIKKKLHI